MQNILWGLLIIGIGLAFGRSVFLGEFSVLNVVFDGLGTFWLGKGLWSLLRGQKKSPPAREAGGDVNADQNL